MASEVEISNRALQKLGASAITSLSDNSVAARACNLCYGPVRDRLYRSHTWNFTKTRVALAADATEPAFGKARSFTLPADYIRRLEPYPEDNVNSLDWQIEGRQIFTNDSAPLNFRYVKRVTDPNEMDALFRELLSAAMAIEMCEQLTQSNSKKEALREDVKETLREARKANAIEAIPAQPVDDPWITARL